MLPYCEIQSIYTRCEFTDIRELTIRDIPLSISADTLFSILVQGIPVPALSNTIIDNFFVALYTEIDDEEALAFGEVADIYSTLPNTNRVQVVYMNATSFSWIVKNNYTIEF